MFTGLVCALNTFSEPGTFTKKLLTQLLHLTMIILLMAKKGIFSLYRIYIQVHQCRL
jgi:hypothetical protein